MKIRELMTRNVACIRCEDCLSSAAQLMWDCDCGAVPVLDSTGCVVGMITDRDICMAAWSKDRPLSSIAVSDAMSKTLYHCTPEDTVSFVENLMRSKQIRRIPVLAKDGSLAGIVSLADIVMHSQNVGTRAAAHELAPHEVTTTLANICQPRPSSLGNARA
ncbi:MAG TPA: CBS domain-containing protein [Polyangiaceae bacterium]|nr:CBS domain-containing protein [Polyangiaceae bacterium]